MDSDPANTFFNLLPMIAFHLSINFLTCWLVVRAPGFAAPTFPSWSHARSLPLHAANQSWNLCMCQSDFGLCSSAYMLPHAILPFVSPSNFMHIAIPHMCISHTPRLLFFRVHLRSSRPTLCSMPNSSAIFNTEHMPHVFYTSCKMSKNNNGNDQFQPDWPCILTCFFKQFLLNRLLP
jgi:hypothetical protein